MERKTIETAPRDESLFLAYIPTYKDRYYVGRFILTDEKNAYWFEANSGEDLIEEHKVIYWQPLQPPKG